MPKPAPLPPAIAARAFAISEAAELGVGRHRLAASDLNRPYRRVRSAQPLDSHLGRCEAFATRLTNEQFFSHVSAALIFGMPLPQLLERTTIIHVSVQSPAFPPQIHGVRAHRLAASTRTMDVNGLRVMHPVDTWLSLATMLGLADLVAVGDYLVTNMGVSTQEIRDAAHGSIGRRGARLMREAALHVRCGVRSRRESLLRVMLVLEGLPEPAINYNIFDDYGRFVQESDLVYPKEKVILEYEGDHHRTDKIQWRKDISRRERAEDLGWRTVRVTDDELGSARASFVARVRRLLAERA